MSLNITNLLNTLQGFYDSSKGAGKKYTGKEEGLEFIVMAYGLSNVTDVTLTEDNLSRSIIENGTKITVSSDSAAKFSYKIDPDTNKVIIFGNNLTITVDEFDKDLVEVVGISNEINATSGDDKIKLFGYDNKVNAKDGKDTVTIYGEDNTIKDSETNIFNGVGGQYLIYDDKEFLAYLNKTDGESETTLNYEKTENGIKFTGDNVKIIAQDDADDKIELVGNKNYLDTSAGADEVTVKGDNNIVVTGVDGAEDTVHINGKGNQIVGGAEDKAVHDEKSGTITIGYTDSSEHTVTINGQKYLIERNISTSADVEISYVVSDDGTITFTGNNAKITAQLDDEEVNADNIVVVGDNNYVDMSVGSDTITVKGEGNVIITGEGEDVVYVNGKNNQVQGDTDDKVYYTGTSGAVTITPEDESQHYITVKGFEYYVERNTDSLENVSFSYSLSSSGVFEFTGNYFKLTETAGDTKDDRVKITGNYNYIDTSDGNDNIDIVGDNNIVHAGEGNDNVVVQGNNNDIYGDEGKDGIAIDGENNTTTSFEYEDKVITLKTEPKENQFQTIEFDDKKYTVALTAAALKAEKEVRVILRNRNGAITIEADDIIVEAGNGQEDVINFIGNNSQIFAKDKNDIINVVGNNNYIDGWTGDDIITATGRNNKALGFLGDDEINIIQTEATDEELEAAVKSVAEKDSDGNVRTDEEKIEIAKQTLAEKNANTANGEFGINTVKASYYTNILNTQIYKSLHNKVDLGLNEDEKKIVVEGKTYTIKNYITYDTNNPFKVPRTVSYEMQDVEVDGEITRQLVFKGDYISVVADDGQDDNVKIIGEKNYLDLKDGMDYLEAQGNYNLLFAGIGDDNLVVKGDENTIQGGLGNDTLQVEGNNTVWKDVETVTGLYESRLTLTNKERSTTITVGDGLEYTIKINASDDEEITENVQFTYSMIDGVLNITGNKIHVIAKTGQIDNVNLKGNDCIIELGDKDDVVSARGLRNEVYGGQGNDIIKMYGDSFKAFGNEGDDTFEISGINSTVYAGDEKGSSANDKLTIMGTNKVNAVGFNASNISNNLTKGMSVITPENKYALVKYIDTDGKEVVFNIESNVQLPDKLADNIYIDWEIEDIKDEEGTVTGKRLVLYGSAISVNLDKGSDKSVNVKIVGSDIRLQTFSGDDVIDIQGNNNKVYVGEGIDGKTDGQNIVNVSGNSNFVYGGKNIDEFNIDGDNNKVYGGGEADKINMKGFNNIFQVYEDGARAGGSLVITKDNQPQIIVVKGKNENKDRAYRINLYNVDKSKLDTIQVPVEYIIDSEGYMTFNADNIKIEVLDSKTTLVTDEVTTDNHDYIRLVGNNCYVTGTNGSDIIKVKGNNNIIDGWYGDDSIVIEEGNNNEIRGFDGNDHITITKGDKNYVNGEEGEDTLDIISGENNSYDNVEKVTKK